jgi:glycosyltransferase involved in cell wall biosynthesis
MSQAGASAEDGSPTLALLPWGDLFEDWLDPLGVGLDDFRDSFSGSWMFGWVEALRLAGVRTVIVAVTSRVEQPLQLDHAPTGARVHLLPPTRLYRRAAGRRTPFVGRALGHIAPYLTTPPLRLANVLRREGCTAVVCQEYETPRFDVAAALGRLQHRPTFATFQGGDYHVSRLERLSRPLTMRLARGFVVPTRSEAERVRTRYRVPEARLERIFNPIDAGFWHRHERAAARAELGLPDAAEVVAWHGQLHPRKGVDLLLEAWAALRASRPGRDLRLVLVGAGEQSGRQLLEASGAAGVELVEEWVLDRRRIRGLLSAADVYAFPSRHEGFPVAPVEAMACSLPVVATAAQGVRDIFEHGEEDGGVVVEREDMKALAHQLGALLDDESRRLELGRRARQRVEAAFALEAVGHALRAFFLDATPSGSPDG